MQGHNDKGRRLVHSAQRTMLATSHSLFAEWWRVSLVENVHLTKHTRTKCHPVCIHFVREQCGKDTEMSATGHYNGNDEGAITGLWLCMCLYEHARWTTMSWLEWGSTSVCCKVNFSNRAPLCLLLGMIGTYSFPVVYRCSKEEKNIDSQFNKETICWSRILKTLVQYSVCWFVLLL